MYADDDRLYRLLIDAPGTWRIEELVARTRMSKTRVRQALRRMHETGAIAIVEEEEYNNAS